HGSIACSWCLSRFHPKEHRGETNPPKLAMVVWYARALSVCSVPACFRLRACRDGFYVEGEPHGRERFDHRANKATTLGRGCAYLTCAIAAPIAKSLRLRRPSKTGMSIA